MQALANTGSGALRLYPNTPKAGGLQSQGAEVAAVVHLLQDLGNTGSGVLRLLGSDKH
jgi:hypothetical protein